MPKPFPFIVSVGRSGTTLLRAMLERHPDLAIPPESYFPVSLAPAHARGPFDAGALFRDLASNPRYRGWELDTATARSALEGTSEYAEAMRGLYAAYAAARGRSRYADKTPAFVLRMGALDRIFPESVFIHLVRDGRDVAASLMEMPFGPSRLGRAAVLWHQWNGRGAISGAKLGPDRYLVLRYEDLVGEPEDALRRVCSFIDLDFRTEMLEHRGNDTHLSAQESAHHASLARPLTPNIRDWRTTLRAADAALFDAIAGETLDRFGYERSTAKVSAATRARAVLEWTAFEAGREVRRRGRDIKAGVRRRTER
ncbi:MAG: hypothetical protein QOE25_199 [Actinomycetota bacterium]|nr:hypothetical protein [Actinomycetota bacterium]